MTTITELVERASKQAEHAGFHDEDITNPTVFASKLALIHSEVSEALEEVRAGQPLTRVYQSDAGKPEGVPTELADIVIRVADLAGWLGIDLEDVIRKKLAYNATRAHKHGKAL